MKVASVEWKKNEWKRINKPKALVYKIKEYLEKAVKELVDGQFPLHHSDRGCQYCSHVYTGKLREYGLGISMTEEMHCYENAKAERVNGILKQEYGLGSTFRTKQQAIASVDQAVMLYNTRRPHLSLKYKTPEEMHNILKKVA